MCLPGTESRGFINGHDPLIPKLDGGGDYNNEEEYMTMRSDRSEGGGGSWSTSFIQNLRQRLHQQLPSNGLPLTEIGEELRSLVKIGGPIVITSLLIYSRSVISMLFLGRLGKAELAGGSLALGFGNITGISIIKGLTTGVALGLAWNTWNLNVGLVIYLAISNRALKPWSGLTILSTFQGWRPLLSLALPSCVSVCLEWWWYEIMLFLCGLLSNPQASVAAMGILIQTTGMLYIFPISISAALSTRVGHSLGAGQPSRAQWAAIIGLLVAFAFGLFAFVFMTCVRNVWGTMFTNEPQILELISTALPILGLCELGNTPQTAACGVLTGTARPKLGARINLYSFYLIGLPVAIIATFTYKVGFLGLWLGLLSAQASCVCMMVYTLVHTDWKQQTRRAEELTLAVEETKIEEKDDEESGLLTPSDL
ncbi:hypothetical protein M0R45_028825 [Rubus argutus]|uniref:Multidrug and toxin extrusion protein n=1 Tax=Rubus argutus TaxID=59490 RepID=A0AAW1WAG4_RUBAR